MFDESIYEYYYDKCKIVLLIKSKEIKIKTFIDRVQYQFDIKEKKWMQNGKKL